MQRLGLTLSLSFASGDEVADPVSDIMLSASVLDEDSAQGTPVGVLSATGGAAPVVFTLTDSAGSRFQIVGAELEAGSAATDFETGTTHSITVRSTDAENRTFDKAFTITVVDIVDEDEYAMWAAAA